MSDIADAGTTTPTTAAAEAERERERAQTRAAMDFAAEVAPDAPRVLWHCSAAEASPWLCDTTGAVVCGGFCAVSSDGSRRPVLVAFERCERPDDARRVACIVLHEVAHLVQATLEGGRLMSEAEAGAPSHKRATWFEACARLSREAFDVEEIGEAAHIGQWPHVLSQVMGWRDPFARLVAALAAAAIAPASTATTTATTEPEAAA